MTMRCLTAVLLFCVTLMPSAIGATAVTDDSISDQVKIRLASDADVGARAIEIAVHNGVVVLTGKVRNDKQKEKAAKIAKKVKGVTSVENNLVVTQE